MPFPPPTERQAHLIWAALTGLAAALLVALLVALVWGLGQVLDLLGPVVWPIAFAGVLAYLLDPVVDWFQRKGMPRRRAILIVFGLALVMMAAWFGSVVPQVINETGQLARKIPAYAVEVQDRIDYWVQHPPKLVSRFFGDRLGLTNEVSSAMDTNVAPNALGTARSTNAVPTWNGAWDRGALKALTDRLAQVLPKVGSWLFGQVTKVASWFGMLVGLTLIPIYLFYFLLEKEGIRSKWSDYLPLAKSEFKDELVFVLQSINDYLIVFFRGQVLVAMCDGILYMIGFLVIGLPYAVLLGVMAMFLTIVPYIGAIITFVCALVIALVQFGNWQHPLLVVAVFSVVQSLEAFVISPKIMGDRVGLHPLTIIIAVMVGTTLLGGLLGGILAIPMTAALRVIMFRYVWKKRKGA